MRPQRPEGLRALGFRSPQDILEVPLRRPLLVATPAVLVFLAAYAVGHMLPERYRSSTLILVESERVPDSFVQKIATESMNRRLQTIGQEVLSRTRLERVIAEIDPYPERQGRKMPLSAAVEAMRSSIRVQTRGTDAFLIEYSHTNPRTAMNVANRLATLFIEEAEGERERQAAEGFEFIDSQLGDMRKTLEEKEETVRRFKEANLGSLPEQLPANLATLQRLQLEQQSVAESLLAAQNRVDQLSQSLKVGSQAGGATDASAELLRLEEQLASLRTRYTDQHPDVQAVLRRIREIGQGGADRPLGDGALASAQLRRAEADLEALRKKSANLEAEMGRLQGRVDRAPRIEQELATLTRDYSQLRESYISLLKKQLDASMAERLERRWKGERFKVLDPAHLPEEAYFPNRPLFAALGLIGGLGLGLTLAFGLEVLDHSIKGPEDLTEHFEPPLLVTIPHLKPERASRQG